MESKKHLYGPVPSRRLGRSLGIDIVPFKTCTFNCVYCQLACTTDKTIERRPYVSAEVILDELRRFYEDYPAPDYLTFAGSGEPTLNSDIGRMISVIKNFTSTPVAVITNGALLYMDEVKRDLADADLVAPSLDAADQETFEKINRPVAGLEIEHIIQGITEFSHRYAGKIDLEIFLVKGLNDSPAHIAKLKEVLRGMRLNKVELNTAVRPPCEQWVKPLSPAELAAVRDILGEVADVEVIARFAGETNIEDERDLEERILDLLARRPAGVDEMAKSLGADENVLAKLLSILEVRGIVEKVRHVNSDYYRLRE